MATRTIDVVVGAPEILIVAAAPLGPQGPPGAVGPFYAGHTFAVLGNLATVIDLPSFSVPKHESQTVKLAGLFGEIDSGVSMKIQIKRNKIAVGPLITLAPVAGGLSAPWTPLGGIVLNNGDRISATMSAPVGEPTTLSATVALEWSVP